MGLGFTPQRVGQMSMGSVLIALQASRKDGRGVTSPEFLEPLNIKPGEVESTCADGGEWASGIVYISVVRYSDFAHVDTSVDAGAQSEAFHAGVVEGFRNAGRFLERRIPAVSQRLRASGLSLRLFVDVRMNEDQMELEFPPEFLTACGRHGLAVYLITNDIPAAEVEAANERTQRDQPN